MKERGKRINCVCKGVTTHLNMGPKREKEHNEDGRELWILKQDKTKQKEIGERNEDLDEIMELFYRVY